MKKIQKYALVMSGSTSTMVWIFNTLEDAKKEMESRVYALETSIPHLKGVIEGEKGNAIVYDYEDPGRTQYILSIKKIDIDLNRKDLEDAWKEYEILQIEDEVFDRTDAPFDLDEEIRSCAVEVFEEIDTERIEAISEIIYSKMEKYGLPKRWGISDMLKEENKNG